MGKGKWVDFESLSATGPAQGDWYFLGEAKIRVIGSNKAFARKEGGRPAVVASVGDGPVMTVWPRSASGGDGIWHRAHRDISGHPFCEITEDGWVCNHVPCAVSIRSIEHEDRSCTEPDESPLWTYLGRKDRAP